MAEIAPVSVAVVVPVVDDTSSALDLLAAIDAWQPPPHRVVIASGAPDARLEAACAARGHRYLDTPRGRGLQLNAGAGAAPDADALWFVHADAAPPPDGVGLIRKAIAKGAESGCFHFAFRGPRTALKTLLEQAIALRIRAGGVAYGDQGLFATRRAFTDTGGFQPLPLFEEVAFVRALRRRGTFTPLAAPIGVSPRRWERDGWLRRTLANRTLAAAFAAGIPAERLARVYFRAD